MGTDRTRPIRVRLAGRQWRIVYGNPGRNHWGVCDPKARKITISDKAEGVRELGTSLHEVLHAIAPYLSEEAMEYIEPQLARVLWRLGWRRME